MDFSGITNPKRVVEKRLAEAEAPPKEEQKSSAVRFGRPYTPEERRKHQAALAQVLRERK
jgi:hypothetical protein